MIRVLAAVQILVLGIAFVWGRPIHVQAVQLPPLVHVELP